MNQALVALVLVGCAMTAYAVVHLLFFRRFRPVERWVVLKRMVAVTLPLLGIAAAMLTGMPTEGSRWPALLAAAVFLWLLHNAWLMFYAFIDRSISIRTNVEAYRAGVPLTFEELRQRYDTEASYQRRLTILCEAGFLEKTGDRYRITPHGASLARKVRFLKNLYRLGKGG